MQLVRAGGTLQLEGATAHLGGSRPGESAADLIFGFIYSRALRRMRRIKERVAAEGCTDPISFDGSCSPWKELDTESVHVDQTTWADDSAFLSRGETPTILRIAAIVLDATKAHALEANLKPGKTEALVALRGRGCRKPTKEWFGCKGPVLTVSTALSGDVQVRVVASYIHLGFAIDRGATFGPEALRRLALANKAHVDSKDLLLQNKAIPRPIHAKVFSAIVETTFFQP